MFGSPRRVIALAGVSVMTAMAAATAAWACVPGGGASGASARKLTISPARAQPGEPITVTAPMASGTAPVEVRLDRAGGPVLLTLQADRAAAGNGGVATGSFVLSTDTPPGQHAVVALQSSAKWDPVVLAVARPDGTVPELRPGPATRAQGGGVSGPALLLLGATAAGLAVAVWSARTGRSMPKVVDAVSP